jgi:DNA-binding response OmpR family regulator
MILVVDDDPVMVAQVCDALRLHGLTADGVTGPREALAWARRQPPALVVSDVVMPELTGFELRRAYAEEFPERATPFLFLSSLDDPASIVAGLDAGADDFLVKPVAAEVLAAKIRVALRRQHRRAGTSFRGDLATLGLPALLRFCEAKGLTGYLDVFAPERVHTLRFSAGRLDDGEAELDAILGLDRGAFVVHSLPLDFGDLASRGRTGPVPILRDQQPVGRVSGVRLHQRLLQVQTELVGGAEPVIITLVTIGGRPHWKQRTACPPGLEPAAIQARLDEQHQAIEAQLEDKLAAALTVTETPAPAVDVNALCDAGYDRFRARDYAGAIAAWEAALALEPNSAALAVNLQVARARAERPSCE